MQACSAEVPSFAPASRGMFSSVPGWFWPALAIGAALRLYLVIFTQGTSDVGIWQGHAEGVNEWGVVGHYQNCALGNHPPLISLIEALLLRAAKLTHIPFRVLLRLPFALLDCGTAFLLISLLWDKPWRFLVAAVYWLHPLAIILSAYH